MQGSSIVVNQDSYTEGVYLWYYYRPVDLHAGQLESGASSTALPFELANLPSPTDDYYNGRKVEVIGDLTEASKGVHTITDYAGSTGIATVAAMSTAAEASDYYGTVSQLPEEAHDLVVAEVTLECVAQLGASVNPQLYNYWRGIVKDAREDFEDLFSTHKAGSKHVRTSEVW
jgi:hydroxypyruvate isomerase